MSRAHMRTSSELSEPDVQLLACLVEYCGLDYSPEQVSSSSPEQVSIYSSKQVPFCSPEQVSVIYLKGEESVESSHFSNLYGSRTATFPGFFVPRIGDPSPLFDAQVRCAIAEESVEAGYPHPAETILARAVINQPLDVIAWFDYLLADEKNRTLVGDILACFAHAAGKTPPKWAYMIAEKALRHSSVAVRDAAAQALEFWGTSDALEILRKHEESAGWLRDYIEEVIELLESA